MATRLKGLTIDRVDLVDKGANPDAHILLYKRAEKEASVPTQEEFEALKKRAEEAESEAALAKGHAQEAEALKKRIDEAEAKAAAAEEVAKRERGERLRRDHIAKAAAFKGLPVKPDEDYMVFEALDSLSETYKAAGARIVDLLNAADEAMVQAGLFKAVGQTGGTGADAWSKIDAMAKRYVAENKAGTHAQAVVKVLDDNPELANQYYATR